MPGSPLVNKRRKAPRPEHAHDRRRAQAWSGREREAFEAALLTWYAASRRAMPWRETRDPYAIWLSEVMLQQTRVETVVPYFVRFLRAYPTVHALAEAPLDDVLTMWSGLGYYRRARMLHAAAQHVSGALGGEFPATAEGLRAIDGIGPYTAGAVASIAFGTRAALVDGNVARVLARLFAIEEDVRAGAGLRGVWKIAEELVSARDPGAWNQALMELGSTVCVPREPRCPACPALAVCAARARGVERDLPRVKAKPRPTIHRRVAVVASLGADVLLARRRVDGRFGGMWEPPMTDADPARSEAESAAALGELLGVPLRCAVLAGAVTHVLSHRRMEVEVLRARLGRAPARGTPTAGGEYDAFACVAPDAFGTRGLTKLARKVLVAAGFP